MVGFCHGGNMPASRCDGDDDVGDHDGDTDNDNYEDSDDDNIEDTK